jgi:osmotically-inducible protein OsmY
LWAGLILGVSLVASQPGLTDNHQSDTRSSRIEQEVRREIVAEIQVLALSPNDDRMRLNLENGNVTLEGVVANEMQKNIANAQANGVSGVFSVTDNLRVEKES